MPVVAFCQLRPCSKCKFVLMRWTQERQGRFRNVITSNPLGSPLINYGSSFFVLLLPSFSAKPCWPQGQYGLLLALTVESLLSDCKFEANIHSLCVCKDTQTKAFLAIAPISHAYNGLLPGQMFGKERSLTLRRESPGDMISPLFTAWGHASLFACIEFQFCQREWEWRRKCNLNGFEAGYGWLMDG